MDNGRITLRGQDLTIANVAVDQEMSPEAWIVRCWGPVSGFVLAHATDGVIWGTFTSGRLHTAEIQEGDPWPPLRWKTLLDLRVFSRGKGELRVWRDGANRLHAVRVSETEGCRFAAYMDRSYVLLGQAGLGRRDEYFDVLQSRRGDRHAVPRGAARLLARHLFVIEPRSGMLHEAEHLWLDLLDHHGEPIEGSS